MNNLRGQNNTNKNENKKDPLEWSPPGKKPTYKVPKKNINYNKNNNNNNNNVVINNKNNNNNNNQMNYLDKNEEKRKYEKPWLVGIKKEEDPNRPMTFLEFCSQNGRPVDEHLIQSLEHEILSTELNVKFDDIVGNPEAKKAIEEACIDPMLYPELFNSNLTKPWKGILLFGPPGTGKTMLAKAIASECNSKFFKITAAALGSKWRGEGEKLVR